MVSLSDSSLAAQTDGHTLKQTPSLTDHRPDRVGEGEDGKRERVGRGRERETDTDKGGGGREIQRLEGINKFFFNTLSNV